MKKRYVLAIMLIVVFFLLSQICLARNISNGKSGKSNIAHLYLYEKDPVNWSIVDNGSWGKMRYELSGDVFDFVFNAHNLTPYLNYTLIYYPDPWPGNGLICLGSDMVNDEGNVHIRSRIDTGDLPNSSDSNYPNGSKIWLVLSDDVDCLNKKMIGWHPSEYLFEYDLIVFDDIDDEPEIEEEENDDMVSTYATNAVVLEDEENEGSIKGQGNREDAMSELFNRMMEKNKKLPPGLLKIWSLMGLIR